MTPSVTSPLAIASLVYDVFLVGAVVWGSLSPQRSIYDGLCFCGLVLPVIVLTPLSIYVFRKGIDPSSRSRPLIINLTTLALCGIITISNAIWDVSFSWHRGEYESALRFIVDTTTIGQRKDVILPPNYAGLVFDGKAYAIPVGNAETYLVAFPTSASDLDGLMSAYVFAPYIESPHLLPSECASGHLVNPPAAHWYYCVIGNRLIYGQ